MSFNPKISPAILIATTLLLATVVVSWSGGQSGVNNDRLNKQDSVPSAKHRNQHKQSVKRITVNNQTQWNESENDNECFNEEIEDVDWDSINEEVENALREVEEHIENLHMEINPERLRERVEESLQDIDVENLNEEIEQAVQQAIENIDFNEIESEIRRSVNQAVEEIKAQRFS